MGTMNAVGEFVKTFLIYFFMKTYRKKECLLLVKTSFGNIHVNRKMMVSVKRNFYVKQRNGMRNKMFTLRNLKEKYIMLTRLPTFGECSSVDSKIKC